MATIITTRVVLTTEATITVEAMVGVEEFVRDEIVNPETTTSADIMMMNGMKTIMTGVEEVFLLGTHGGRLYFEITHPGAPDIL
jgi:hypothetical protein